MNTFQVLENSIPPKTYAIVVRFGRVTEGENPCPCGGRCHDIELFDGKKAILYWCDHYQGTRHEPSVMAHASRGRDGKNGATDGNKLTILCNVEAVMKAEEEKNRKLDEEVMEKIESSILEIKAKVERAMDCQEILNKLKEAGSKE